MVIIMFEFVKYDFKLLFKQKSFTVLTVILLVFGFVGFISVTSVTYSLNRAIIDYTDSCYGDYTMILSSDCELDLRPISSSVELYGNYSKIGYVGIDEQKGKFSYGCIDVSAYELLKIKVLNGEFPKSKYQVAIEEQTAEYLEKKVGDILIVSINGLVTENVEVSAIINNYSAYQGFIGASAESYFAPILCGGDISEIIDEYGESNHLTIIKTDGSSEINGKVQLFSSDNKAHCVWNNKLSDESFVSALNSGMVLIFSVMLIIVFFISILCIFNYENYPQKRLNEQADNLRICGADDKFTFAFFVCDLLLKFMLSLPIILIANRFVLKLSQTAICKIIPYYELHMSKSLIFAVVLAVFAILLYGRICAFKKLIGSSIVINKSYRGHTIRRKNYKIPSENLIFVCSVKSLLNYKSEYIKVVLLMSLCALTVMTGDYINDYLKNDVKSDYDYDYSLTCVDGNYITQFQVPFYTNYGISNDELEQFDSLEEVLKKEQIRKFPILISEYSTDRLEKVAATLKSCAYDVSSYDYEAELLGIKTSENLYTNKLFGLDEGMILDILGSYEVSLSDIEKYKTGEKIFILTDSIDDCPYKSGDTIHIKQFVRGDDKQELYRDIINIYIEVGNVYYVNDMTLFPEKLNFNNFAMV